MTGEAGWQPPLHPGGNPDGRSTGSGKFTFAPADFSEMIEALTAVGIGLGVAKRTIDRLSDTRLDEVSKLLGRTLDQYWRASRAVPRLPHESELLGWGRAGTHSSVMSRNGARAMERDGAREMSRDGARESAREMERDGARGMERRGAWRDG
jgi:hypothetical protein